MEAVSFGPFRLYPAQRLLKKGEDPVRLGARAFDILLALVERAGEVVAHKDLIAKAWPNVIVEETSLRVHLVSLRKALDGEQSSEYYITNVKGRGYCFSAPVSYERSAPDVESPLDTPLSLPDKPSIAVLPFQNLSSDPEQEFFADGMVEEIITALSRFKALFVIARNSSFTYKGRAVEVKQVGRELGVRYVLEGSVRKAANRVRVTGQLVDTATGAHLWADHFDGTFADIFDLQDRLTATIVGAIAPRVEQAEIERTKRKPTDRLDAYDYYLRGVAGLTIRKAAGARELFLKAVELDPSFAVCYAMAAHCYELEVIRDGLPPAEVIAETTRLARRAVLLGNEDAVALTRAGHALAFVAGEIDEGATLLDRAIVLNPNLALAWHQGGWTKIYVGESEQAIERFSRAMRLSPLDPLLLPWIQSGTALAHLFAGQYDQAATWAEKALRDGARNPNALRTAAASFALAGRLEEARKVVARFLEVFPEARVSRAQAPFYYLRRPEDLARYVKGLRLAGLPE